MLPIRIFGFTISRDKNEPLVESDLSPAQELAILQSRYAAREQLQTISFTRALGFLVLVLVMYISYGDQRQYVLEHHATEMQARLIPIVFDIATLYFVMVIGAKAMRRAAVYTSIGFVFFPVSLSAYINFRAAPDDAMQIILTAVSLLIPAVEIVRALLGADFRRMRAQEDKVLRAATEPLAEVPAPATKIKKATVKRGDKRDAAAEVMSRNPNMTPKELALAISISGSYATKLHRELRGELVDA